MPVIDTKSLLAEISPDAPSGAKDLKDEGDEDFIKLEIDIKGTPEHGIGKLSGKEIIQEAKEPKWDEIKKAAVALLGRVHDLRVVMYLIRALLRTDGLKGLNAGLSLLNGLVARYWDSLYPQLDPEDDNDPAIRISILAALSEGDDILVPLKRIDLCNSPTLGRFHYRDILIASGKVNPNDDDKSPPPNEKTILAAFKDTDVDFLVEYKETLGAIIGNLAECESTLAEKLIESGASIGFSGLRNTLTEMEAFLKQQLQGRIPEEQTDSDQAQASSQAGGMPAAGSGNTPKPSGIDGINSRQDVILVLDRICKYYQLYEPGSPVPMLLKRARQLVDKDFIEIIQDLAPDSADKIKNLISGPEKEAKPSK